MKDFFAELAGDVRTDLANRLLYSTDASIYQAMPLGVLIPKSVEELAAAVGLAHRYRVPLLARGGGSSLAGQAVNEALVIDCSRYLDGVLQLNVEEKWVRVRPGIVLDELNHFLAPVGLQFGPDPASSNRACLGGIISNNATGSHSIRYGLSVDHLLEAEVILSDGSLARFGGLTPAEAAQRASQSTHEGYIYRSLLALLQDQTNRQIIQQATPRHWRRCGGYNLDRLLGPEFNLASLICGAEGTLGVISELKLNLVSRPGHTGLAILHFNDLPTALAAVPTILESQPSAVELLENLALTLCRGVAEYGRLLQTFMEGQPFCLLVTEYQGQSQAEVKAKLTGLQRLAVGATTVVLAEDRQRQANVWQVRKVALGLLMSARSDFKPIAFIEDAAVPIDRLADYVTKIEQFCRESGTPVTYYGHASAGCLHIRPLMNLKLASEVVKMSQIAAFAAELVKGYGGALSSEHGDGRTRSWLNQSFFGPELYELYRQVKAIFDPQQLLNPGNIVDGRPMTQSLRYGPAYETISLPTYVDFGRDGGLSGAVEMCNGAGVCRKRLSGAMCPSFMVTREEEHSTRGRANLLRAAMAGQFPAGGFTSPRLYQAMDLCVECKACKAECPSAVDMAKLKVEFLAHYQAEHGVPLRSRLFAAIGLLNRLGSGRLAGLSNGLLQNGPFRRFLERRVGITAGRPLPSLARQPFLSWFAQRRGRKSRPELPNLVLLLDPFTNYNEPQVAVAATELLEQAGFVVWPILPGEARPAISKGLVKAAKAISGRVVSVLFPYVQKGWPIVGLEPSSLLTLRDEYLSLLPDNEQATQVAGAAWTFEEFVATLADRGTLGLTFGQAPGPVLLHAHCHQRALVGTAPGRRILGLLPDCDLTEIDSGCCGMAGSFGYEVEHLAWSLKMAEHRLLPAVRSAPAGSVIVAAGFSCRQQIRFGSGREALHPAQLLRTVLLKPH